jgi:hypothetical protein
VPREANMWSSTVEAKQRQRDTSPTGAYHGTGTVRRPLENMIDVTSQSDEAMRSVLERSGGDGGFRRMCLNLSSDTKC